MAIPATVPVTVANTVGNIPVPPHATRPPKSVVRAVSPDNDEIPSSDIPPEDDANPYPEIGPFLDQLNKKAPRRELTRYTSIFEEKDFYNINQVAKLSEETLISKAYGLSQGNAQYLLERIGVEMRKVRRAGKARA